MKKLSLLILSSFLFTACITAGPDINPPVEETEEIPEIMDADIVEEEVTEDETAEEEATEEEEAEEEVVTEATSAEYMAYTKETYDSLLGQSPVVLYFHANWCPVCIQLDSDISGAIGDFPAGSTILKLDFDEEIELRQEYGVTVQSTLITINAAGEVVEKLSAPSNSDLIAAIEKTL